MRWPRRKVVLAAGLGSAGVLAVVVATRDGSTGAGAAASSPAPRTTAGEPAASMPVVDLRLELLDQPRADPGEAARNPFRFRPRPAPLPPKPASAPPPARAAAAAPPKPAVPAAPAGPPPIPLRMIGMFDAPGQAGQVAIMSDGRGNVFQGKEGDIIEGRYRVGRVTADSLELSYTDGRGRQVIRLTGQ